MPSPTDLSVLPRGLFSGIAQFNGLIVTAFIANSGTVASSMTVVQSNATNDPASSLQRRSVSIMQPEAQPLIMAGDGL